MNDQINELKKQIAMLELEKELLQGALIEVADCLHQIAPPYIQERMEAVMVTVKFGAENG